MLAVPEKFWISDGPLAAREARASSVKKCELMAVLFNILIVEGIYPGPWKLNRTTLLPKPGKDVADVRNWRPITIGSMLGRLFSDMLDHKLREFV